jgi:hypothetical protein
MIKNRSDIIKISLDSLDFWLSNDMRNLQNSLLLAELWPEMAKKQDFRGFFKFPGHNYVSDWPIRISFDSQKSQLSNDIFIISELFFIIEL